MASPAQRSGGNGSGDDGASRLGGHVGRLVAGEVVNKAARFIALTLLARSLAPSEFGQVNLGIAIAGLMFVASSLGLSEAGAREVARYSGRAGWFAGRIIAVRVAALGALAAPVCLLAAALQPRLVPLLLVSSGITLSLILGADWLARGLEKTRPLAIATAAGGFVVLAGVAVLGPRLEPISALAVFVVGETAAAVVTWRLVTRDTRPEFGLRDVRRLLHEARPLAVSALVLHGYYSTFDTILVAALRSDAEAGLYSAPYRIFLMVSIVATFAAYAMLPRRVRTVQAEVHARDDPVFYRALPALAAYGLTALATVEVAGTFTMGVLFGARFEDTQPALVLLMAGGCWYAIGYPVGYALIAEGHYRRFLNGGAIAAMVSLGMNLALIPLIGYVGAAATTLASLIVASARWLSYQGLIRAHSRLLATAILATGGAIVAASAPSTAGAIGAATFGLAVFAAAPALNLPLSRGTGNSDRRTP